MATMITFYDENSQNIGFASFSSFSAPRQKREYGISWCDCVIWVGPDGAEYYGRPGDPDGAVLPYTPDWSLCLSRARSMLEGAEKTSNAHRKEYDLLEHTVPRLVSLLEACASNPHRDQCTIRVW